MFLDRDCVVATDVDELSIRVLMERFENNSHVHVFQLDLNNFNHNFIHTLQDYHLDTIININVLEHIKGDREALSALKEVLSDGGNIITIVPSFQKLFGSLDEAYGHYRRYNKEDFTST